MGHLSQHRSKDSCGAQGINQALFGQVTGAEAIEGPLHRFFGQPRIGGVLMGVAGALPQISPGPGLTSGIGGPPGTCQLRLYMGGKLPLLRVSMFLAGTCLRIFSQMTHLDP
ncbi:hypothetical protein GCM10007359_15290 [Rothia aerolata]|uniref:Uncharacterized protein n=1 Tax=Rothia aerolata TaxID=1812262 RepID=A0A917MTT6_9MICC|nr:hypothetical protein GCM10007359_15290 [Rothia aerolata]